MISRNEEATYRALLAQRRGSAMSRSWSIRSRPIAQWKSRGGLAHNVFQREFTNYVDAEAVRARPCHRDWVLLMDADEQATHDLRQEIERAASSRPIRPTATRFAGFSIISATTTRARIYPDRSSAAVSPRARRTSADATRMTK